MKSFTFYVNDELKNDHVHFLKVCNPVCELISLYSGPSLINVNLVKTENSSLNAKGLKNEYAFTFQFDSITSVVQLNYFLKGNPLLKITIQTSGETLVFLAEDGSLTAEIELRKALLKYSLSEPEIMAAAKSVNPTNSINDEFYELTIGFKMPYIDNAKFLQNMYELCSEFSVGTVPGFSPEMVITEKGSEIPERLSYLTVSNETNSVQFEDYSCDSGSHSYPEIYRYEFIYKQDGKILIQVNRTGSSLIFQTRYDDRDRFQMRVRQYFEGKF